MCETDVCKMSCMVKTGDEVQQANKYKTICTANT